ncbi:hypothetical protein [Pelomonas sp. KK5]|uniref:hypothetical protein n=1 Tax=Pelomonas sp. KK5 TaxID=1855730 RepID=UPI00097C1624|nr:hypothetical protein [Pelomonas sp. KK5]
MATTQTTRIRSRLLQRLEQEIAAAGSPLRAAPLAARRAILLIRHGESAAARAQLTELHQLGFSHPQSGIAGWLQLAEGLMSFYADLGDGGFDKLQRAEALARAARQPELEALACAWLAMLSYLRQDIEAVARHARRCLDIAAPDDHASRGRLAIALALAHDECDQPAQPWYANARRHAMQDGDDAALSALMFNMAAMRASRARYGVLSGGLVGSGVPMALMAGAQSAQHYDRAIGVAVKDGLTPLVQAQVLAINGDHAGAQALYEQHLPEAMSQGLARLNSVYLSDLAWCRIKTGQKAQALQQAQRAELEIDPACHLNDRAATHARLAQVYAELNQQGASTRHAEEAERLWQAVAAQQQRWAQLLAENGLSSPP